MNKLLKKEKGITLIALVVTIIILIILAAVSMSMILGNNGLFEQARKGANTLAEAEVNTQKGFNSMSAEIDKILNENGVSEQAKETIENAKNTAKEFTEPKTEVIDSKGNKVAEDSGDTVQQGIVIEDVSASGDDNVKGSQFVWIPAGTLWNRITQLDASKVSIKTYSASTTVKSDLINSYAWDTAIVYIQEVGNVNYANQTSKNENLSNTGTNEDEVCKINGMASNIIEWTTEYTTYINNSEAYACCSRGGKYYNSSNNFTVLRNSNNVTGSASDYGFRFILYM